jgi:hypothetical protein
MRAMSRAVTAGWLAFPGCLLALVFLAPVASGYDTFGDGYGSKWDDPQFGTGAIVSWSFLTPGVGLTSNPAIANLSGTNTLGSGDPAWDIRSIRAIYGSAPAPVPLSPTAGGVFAILLALAGARGLRAPRFLRS